MNALMAKQNYAVAIRQHIPRRGDPKCAEKHGIIAGQIRTLPTKRQHQKRHMNRTLQPARALVTNAKRGEFGQNIGD